MKKLVIYYSYDGNTRFIAEAIADAIHADIAELKTQKATHATGVMMFAWGVRQLVSQSEPKLLPLDKNPADYDLIILGTPVWTFTFAPQMRTFLKHHTMKGKNIALFCCHGGQPGKTIGNMKELLDGNHILSENDFMEPLKQGKEISKEKAMNWAKKLVK